MLGFTSQTRLKHIYVVSGLIMSIYRVYPDQPISLMGETGRAVLSDKATNLVRI